jgi:hypothetical protein
MAIFEAGLVQTTAPGTISTMIWNPAGTSTTTYGALGSIPSTTVFHDVTVVNQGTCNVYVNSGSAAAATMLGVLLTPGGQLTVQGYSGTVGTAGTIWANTGTLLLVGACAAGMPSVASVV